MKKILIITNIIFLISITNAFSQHYPRYRTIASGSWGTPGIWEYSLSGNTWILATAPPDYTVGDISIRSNHIVDVSGMIIVDEVSCQGGLILNVGGVLNLLDGPGTELSLRGILYGNGGYVLTNGTSISISVVEPFGSFRSGIKVQAGTTFFGAPSDRDTIPQLIEVNEGATLTATYGGYISATGTVLNYGTIGQDTTTGLSNFRYLGNNFVNNGKVRANITEFKSSSVISGTGFFKNLVYILNGANVSLGSDHSMGSITIFAGGTFNLSGYKLSLSYSNPIINYGTFNTTTFTENAGTGTIEYNGTSQQTISTGNIIYRNLRINNAQGTTLTSPGLTINDTLSLVSGDLYSEFFDINLGPNAYLLETPGNEVFSSETGGITVTQNLNAPSAINVKGLGAIITSASNLGNTTIKRGNTIHYNLNGNTSIQRYYDIAPSNNSGLNATLTFKYDESELSGKPEGSLSLFRSTDNGNSWTFRGGTVNTSSNEITLSGIDAFSRWSAASGYVSAQIKVIPEGFYDAGSNKLIRRDTVRAYLRNISPPFDIVDSAKAKIDSITFSGTFTFVNAPSGTYYIQVKHRNSIETWSKSGGEIYSLGTSLTFDFTSNASQAFGNNLKQADTSPLRFAIFSGDVNQDGSVDLTDLTAIDNDAINFVFGYVSSDVNGDGAVDLSDLTIADNNAFNYVSVIRP